MRRKESLNSRPRISVPHKCEETIFDDPVQGVKRGDILGFLSTPVEIRSYVFVGELSIGRSVFNELECDG